MPLPPAPVDAFRRWSADRWKDATDATIGRVKSGLWDVQATQAIDGLSQQLARLQEEERQRREEQARQEAEHQRQLEEQQARNRETISSTVGGALGGIGERVGAGFSGIGQTGQRGAQGLQETAGGWAARAEDAIGSLGQGLTEFGGGFLEEAGATGQAAAGAVRTVQAEEREALRKLTGQGPQGPEPTTLPQQLEGALGYLVPPQYRAPGRFAGEFVEEQGGSPLEQAAATGAMSVFGPGGTLSSIRTGLQSQAPNAIRALPAAGALLGGAGGVATGVAAGAPPEELLARGAEGSAIGGGVGELGTLLPAVPYVFRRGGDLLGDLSRRYGTTPDDTLGAVGRGAAALRPANTTQSGLMPRDLVEPPGGWRDPRTREPLVDPRTGEPVRPPEKGVYVTKNEYNYWNALERGRNPFTSTGKGPNDPSMPFYRWDLFAEPPPLGPGGTKPGRMNLEPLPEVDWDAELVARNNGQPWSYGVTGPDTVQELLRLYDDEDIPMKAAAVRLGLTGAQGRAAVRDATAAINRMGYPYKKTGNEWTAAGAERDVGKYGYTSSQPDAVPHRYDSAYEVVAAMRLDALVEQGAIRGWRKGGGKRSRVRFVIDPARAFHPATNPGGILDAGREGIYTPDFLVDLNDGTQGMVEVKNLGAMGQDPWKVEEKADFARQVFDRWGMPFEVWAEDQLGRPFLRELATAAPGSLPPSHPLARVPAGERVGLQQKLRGAVMSAQDPAFREAGAQHLLDFNAANPYPRIPGDAAADLEALVPALQAQLARHNAVDVGGSTFSPVGVDMAAPRAEGGEGGWMVSVAPERAMTITGRHDLHPIELARFVKMNEDLLKGFAGRLNIGTWKTTARTKEGLEVPQVVVDLSLRVDDEETARQIGNLYRQKAVYNIDTRASTDLARRFWVSTKLPRAEREDELRRILGLAAAAADARARGAGVGGRVPGVGAPVYGAADRPGPLAGAGDDQPGAGLPGGPAPAGVAPDGGAGLRLGRSGVPGGTPPAPGLGTLLRDTTGALMPYGAAGSRGERAFDLTTGTLGGALAAGTAEEDATWQERAGRFALGSAAGALVGPTGRSALGAVGRSGALDEAGLLGARGGRGRGRAGARGRTPATPTPTPGGLLGDVATVTTGLGLGNPASLFTNLTGGVLRTATRVARELAGETGNPLDAFTDLAGMGAELFGQVPRFFREVGQGPTQAGQQLVGQRVGGRDLTRSQHPLAKAATIGTRVNAATDEVIGALNEAGARAVALRRGEDPNAAGKRAQEFATYRNGLSSPIADLLSKGGSWLSDPTKSAGTRLLGGVLYTFAPYVRMPERLLVESVKTVLDPYTQTPRWLRRWGTSDAAERAVMREARARVAVGTAVSATLYSLWAGGNLTGEPPSDPAERRRREAEGAQWNTLRVGGVPVPLGALGDLGNTASLLASTLTRGQEAIAAGEDPGEIATAVGNEVLRWSLSESYLRDLAKLGSETLQGRGVEQLQRAAGRVAARPLAPLRPFTAADPVEREEEGFLSTLQARVPGLRERLPVRLDPSTGEALPRRGSGLTRALGMDFGPGQTETARELARYGITPREVRAGDEYAGMEQNAQQARTIQRALGSEAGRLVRETTASSEYRQADEAGKEQLLRRALDQAADEADIAAGEGVARDPKRQAQRAWEAVPKFEGVNAKGAPDDVRRENLRVRRARSALSAAKTADPRNGERRFRDEHPEQYRLAQRDPISANNLRARREAIEKQYGVQLP